MIPRFAGDEVQLIGDLHIRFNGLVDCSQRRLKCPFVHVCLGEQPVDLCHSSVRKLVSVLRRQLEVGDGVIPLTHPLVHASSRSVELIEMSAKMESRDPPQRLHGEGQRLVVLFQTGESLTFAVMAIVG